MSENTKALRVRIKSVTSTMQLTNAMGLVASSKIRRANQAMLAGREYLSALDATVNELANDRECLKSPYMQVREPVRTRLIVITGDRGLAGGYNANVFRFAKEYPDAEFIPIGKRANERFGGELFLAEKYSYADAIKLARTLCEEFANESFDKLGIIGTKYVSMMSQVPQIKWLLPLTREAQSENHSMIFEPDEITVLNSAVLEYIAGMIMTYVKESYASEVAARRMAMDSAGKNAQTMIDDLSLAYNRARQGAITQEITEIVAGSGE